MSSSVARMERRAARTREQKKSGGMLQSSMSRAVLAMARDHAAGSTRRLDVTDLLSKEGFDEALVAAAPRIIEKPHLGGDHGLPLLFGGSAEFDMAGFVRKLTDEACHMEFPGTLADGSRANIRTDLFSMPVVGWLGVMESFIQTPESIQILANSFRECGLPGKGSSIVLSPSLVDVDAAADVLPGTARVLTQLMMEPLWNSELALGEAMSRLLGLEPSPIDGDDSVIAHRLLVGVRVQVVKEGEPFEEDVFSYGSPSHSHGLDLWRSKVASMLPPGLQILQPLSFIRGRSALAFEIVAGQLLLEAHSSGLDISTSLDEIHLAEDGGQVMVTAIHEGRNLGPVRVPSLAALSDADWFAEQIVGMSKSTVGQNVAQPRKEILQ